jgi:hypothetical protein
MKEIELSKTGKNKGLYVALVDDADYEWLNQFNWSVLSVRSGGKYANRVAGKRPNRLHLRMHRVVMGITDPNVQVDHRDGNGLNNCRSNLRVATPSQNGMNRQKHKLYGNKPTTSKYKGVRWHKRDEKWYTQAQLNGKHFSIGYFDNEDEAARAYNKFAKEHFGGFARLNKIEE